MMQISELIKKWSESVGDSEENTQKAFNDSLDKIKGEFPSLTPEQQTERAVRIFTLSLKRQMRSPAVAFEGVIIGVGDLGDLVEKKIRDAIEMFRMEPQKAIELGVCDRNGVPLETMKEWRAGQPNANYGKPLPPHNYRRIIYGVATKTKVKNDKPKLFRLTISGDNALRQDYPLFEGVTFRAIDKTPVEIANNEYVLNASVSTNLEQKKLNLPPILEIMKQVCGLTNFNDLQSYHDNVRDDFNRLVLVEGDVSLLNLEPSPNTGNRRLVLESTDVDDITGKGVTVWVHKGLNIDFAEGSRVVVIGRTTQGKKKDELGNLTEEDGDLMINAYGVYCLPEFKIAMSVEPLNEKDIE